MFTTGKYAQRSEQDAGLYGGPVTWPGVDGIPVRGNYQGLLRQAEYEQSEVVPDFHAETFNSWDPESAAQYARVMDHVVNGQFSIYRRTPDQWVPEKGGWTWRMEWMQLYAEPARPGLTAPPAPPGMGPWEARR